MKKALFSPIIAAFLTLLLLVIVPNGWIEGLIPTKQRVSQAATQLNPLMFQGKYIQTNMLQDPRYLPIYGSSELNRLDEFHPSNYFKENNIGFTPFLIGQGGSISLIHFLNFAEHIDGLKEKKLVFIVSPQWFQLQGADPSHFVPNYSSLQAYDLAFNKELDPNVKKMAMKRLLHMRPVRDDLMLSTLYNGEISNNPWEKRKAALVRPFAYMYKGVLGKKDLYYAWYGGKPHYPRQINPEVRNKSWSELKSEADRMGRRQSTNNPFLIIDSKYNKFKNRVGSYRGTSKGRSYGQSIEYYDFQLMLDVLKQADAKPLFVSIPVNGRWYDYIGFPKSGRTTYYKRIKQQIEAAGYPVADFSGHEYDPYFMKDTLHIGWKGWVYVDKAIKDFYTADKGT
jgi:D-alanine transfer protein